MDPEDSCTGVGCDGHRGEAAEQPLVDRSVEGLADEVLIGRRDEHGPSGKDHVTDAAGCFQ